MSSQLCDAYDIKNKNLFLNPYLLNWIKLWLSRDNSKEENKTVEDVVKASAGNTNNSGNSGSNKANTGNSNKSQSSKGGKKGKKK